MTNKAFGTLLRTFREAAKDPQSGRRPLKQVALSELLETLAGTPLSNTDISRLEMSHKKILVSERQILRGIVLTLVFCDGIKSLDEANELLNAGGYVGLDRGIDKDEIDRINERLEQLCREYKVELKQLVPKENEFRDARIRLGDCIGREALLHELLAGVSAKQWQSFYLHSPLPNGKSTILVELQRRLKAKYSERLIVSLIRADHTDYSPAAFWHEALQPIRYLSDTLLSELVNDAVELIRTENGYFNLVTLFEKLTDKPYDKRFVLLIDAFDRLVVSPQLRQDQKFFTTLRRLTAHWDSKLSVVIASQHSCTELVDKYESQLAVGSPFCNSWKSQEIGVIDREELIEILNHLFIIDADRQKVVRAAGYHPYLLKELLNKILNHGLTAEESIRRLYEDGLDQQYLKRLWRSLNKVEQAILLAMTMAEMKEKSPSWETQELVVQETVNDTLTSLNERGLIEQIFTSQASHQAILLDTLQRRWRIGFEALGLFIRDSKICSKRADLSYEEWFGPRVSDEWLDRIQWNDLTSDLTNFC
jgi:hypothetical protein